MDTGNTSFCLTMLSALPVFRDQVRPSSPNRRIGPYRPLRIFLSALSEKRSCFCCSLIFLAILVCEVPVGNRCFRAYVRTASIRLFRSVFSLLALANSA